MTIQLDTRSWAAGCRAGLAGTDLFVVPAGVDGLSWRSGYVEGKAARDGFEPKGVVDHGMLADEMEEARR